MLTNYKYSALVSDLYSGKQVRDCIVQYESESGSAYFEFISNSILKRKTFGGYLYYKFSDSALELMDQLEAVIVKQDVKFARFGGDIDDMLISFEYEQLKGFKEV